MTDLIELSEDIEIVAEGGLADGNTKEYDSAWVKMNDYLLSGERIDVLIVDQNKGGLIADMGIKAFIPKGNLSMTIARNMDKYIGQTLTVKVLEVDQESDRVLLSERVVTDEDNAKQRKETLATLKVGAEIEGAVKRIAEFGAFVDIGGIDGLLHVSDMSWQRVEDPNEVVKVKDTVTVKILRIDDNGKRISLGLKQLTENPWNLYRREANVGDTVECTVVKVDSFGATVNVREAIDGVIQTRDLSDKRSDTAVGIVEVGDVLIAKITDLNAKERKLTLSVNAAKRDTERAEFRSYLKDQEQKEKELTPTLGDLFGDIFSNIKD